MFEYLIDDNLICKDDRIAVGVSGGADSMLLLWALIDKQKTMGFEMTVIHINHNIRKDTSRRDQNFVEDFCKKRKINEITVSIDVNIYKNQEKYTLEEAARKLRYDAFEKVMAEYKLNKLFLAHHKNDQAETILMHIFRGSGIAGACGIRQSSRIIRPLLNLTKSEILSLCDDYKIEFVCDETNENNYYSRNCIRNQIIPMIEKIYPKAIENIFKFGKRCEEVQEYTQSLINSSLIEKTKDVVTLKDSAFDNPSFIVREYIKRIFEILKIFEDIEAKHYIIIYELQKSEVNKQVDLPHKIIAKRTYNGIRFFKQSKNKTNICEYEFSIGTINIDRIGKIETKFVSKDEIEYGVGILYADYNKISTSSVWRIRKQGDIFAKLGTGSKKLNDYFTDKKIDIDKRDKIPVLATNNNILIVAGEDISENVKIDGETDKIIAIKFFIN